MRLAARLEKLEYAINKNNPGRNPFDEARYQEFEDWVMNDPKAKELLKREFDYCMERGYPQNEMEFYDELDDPVFWEMGKETLDAFDKYLRGRVTV
jgi:hypothetical protein